MAVIAREPRTLIADETVVIPPEFNSTFNTPPEVFVTPAFRLMCLSALNVNVVAPEPLDFVMA